MKKITSIVNCSNIYSNFLCILEKYYNNSQRE